MFIDRVIIEVRGGRGGNGCMSFRRERFVPRGGPDGGDGGRGGNVIIEARDGVNSLSALAHNKHWRAESGTPGGSSNRHGRNGKDVTLPVPAGTVVWDEAAGFVLKDLAADGDTFIAARGGHGGFGNTHFKSSTNRAPREHNLGEEGEQRRLVLELKSIADVGLVGLPNAGKSTLLSRLSHARHKSPTTPSPPSTPTSAACRSTWTARSSWPTSPV